MPDKELSFEGFLLNVNPVYQDFVTQIHTYLLENGCKLKLQLAKNGYVVSYSHVKSKRVLLNFVFRKSGLVTRIYGDLVNQYVDFMDTAGYNVKVRRQSAGLQAVQRKVQ